MKTHFFHWKQDQSPMLPLSSKIIQVSQHGDLACASAKLIAFWPPFWGVNQHPHLLSLTQSLLRAWPLTDAAQPK